MAAGKKRSLLGQHRADDEEYWEHFTDGMVLPGVQITNDDEGLKQEVEDEAAYYTYKDSGQCSPTFHLPSLLSHCLVDTEH